MYDVRGQALYDVRGQALQFTCEMYGLTLLVQFTCEM